FNPGVRQTLADLAEVARAEAEYWDREVDSLLPGMVRPGKPSRSGRTTSGKDARTLALDLVAFRALPLALQRQLLHRTAQQFSVALEFKHIQQLIELSRDSSSGKKLPLPGGMVVVRSFRELQFTRSAMTGPAAD